MTVRADSAENILMNQKTEITRQNLKQIHKGKFQNNRKTAKTKI